MKERYIAEIPFPEYSYIPKKTRRPGENHLPGFATEIRKTEPDNFHVSKPFLYSLDLFNYGYYWEAHEIWETFWNHFGRTTDEAIFFKILIKLAAAGVKYKEGNSRGVSLHLAAAGELLERLHDKNFAGINFKDLSSVKWFPDLKLKKTLNC